MKIPSETFFQGNAEIMVSDGMLIRIENTGTTPCDVVELEFTRILFRFWLVWENKSSRLDNEH